MSWTLARIFRHPVKSLGEEALSEARLEVGRPVPFDRAWAVAHGRSAWDPAAPGWLHCREFVTQRHVAEMARTRIAYEAATGTLTLSHPERPDLSVKPAEDDGAAALTAWLAPLAEGRQNGPYRLAAVSGGAFTDGEVCHVSLASTASREDLETRMGLPLAPIRFRMNLWIDGMDPWREFELEGRALDIGEVRLKVLFPCARCNATNANPETGAFDAGIPEFLQKTFGHANFGMNAQVVGGGLLRRGDPVAVV